MFQIDEELIQQLIKKQKEAYEVFYTRTVDILFRYIKSHYFVSDEVAEDMMSEFYFKFWRVVEKYNSEFKFASYIWIVFKSVIKDYFRKNQHQYTVDDLYTEKIVGDEKSILDFMEEDFQMEKIDEAMKNLRDAEKEIIFLKFIEEKTYEEMEELLGISQTLLRQKVFRALKKIKENITIE